jgi:hypothetical protein
MKPFFAGLLVAVTSLVIVAPAQAAPQTRYFDCTGTTPVQNVDASTFSWSGTAPAASYQSGAGCGWADPLLTNATRPNTQTDAAFGGEYAGEIRKIDLTLYALDPALGTLGKVIDVDVLVDGETVASFSQLSSDDAGGPAPVPAIAKYNYTLDGLDIPAGTDPKSIVLALGAYNEGAAWLQGAAEVPSGVKLYAFEDLTCDEQAAIDDTIICDEG